MISRELSMLCGRSEYFGWNGCCISCSIFVELARSIVRIYFGYSVLRSFPRPRLFSVVFYSLGFEVWTLDFGP